MEVRQPLNTFSSQSIFPSADSTSTNRRSPDATRATVAPAPVKRDRNFRDSGIKVDEFDMNNTTMSSNGIAAWQTQTQPQPQPQHRPLQTGVIQQHLHLPQYRRLLTQPDSDDDDSVDSGTQNSIPTNDIRDNVIDNDEDDDRDEDGDDDEDDEIDVDVDVDVDVDTTEETSKENERPRIQVDISTIGKTSITQYRTEGAIEKRMDELRELYRRSLAQYIKIGGTFPYSKDHGSDSRAVWDNLNDNYSSSGSDHAKRGRRRVRDLDDLNRALNERAQTVSPGPAKSRMSPPTEPRKLQKSPQLFKNKSPGRIPSAFSTKPTAEEIKFDALGHKSYKCLRCGRTFTHPPAFSQHKRFHGREAGRVAAAAASVNT